MGDGTSPWIDMCHPPLSPQLLASKKEQNFLSTNFVSSLVLSSEQPDPTFSCNDTILSLLSMIGINNIWGDKRSDLVHWEYLEGSGGEGGGRGDRDGEYM